MIVLVILLLLIALIFFVPYGVDAAYEKGVFVLRVKAGPLRIKLFPRKPKTEKQLQRDAKKKAKKEAKRKAAEEKKKAEAQIPPEEKEQNATLKVKKKREIDLDFILALLKMGAHAIRRFFKSFSIDFFKLHYTVSGKDPYDTAMLYGYACSAVEALPALCGNVIHVKRKDIALNADFVESKPEIDVRIVISLRLFLLVHMACAFGVEYIKYTLKKRKEASPAVIERKEDHGREQDQ